MQQLIIAIVIMYLVVGAAALWYRRNQHNVLTQGTHTTRRQREE